MKKNNSKLQKCKTIDTSFVSDLNLKDKDNLLKVSLGTFDFNEIQNSAKDYLQKLRSIKAEKSSKQNKESIHSGSKRTRDGKNHKSHKHKNDNRYDTPRQDYKDRKQDGRDDSQRHRERHRYGNDGWGSVKAQRTYSESPGRDYKTQFAPKNYIEERSQRRYIDNRQIVQEHYDRPTFQGQPQYTRYQNFHQQQPVMIQTVIPQQLEMMQNRIPTNFSQNMYVQRNWDNFQQTQYQNPNHNRTYND